MTRREVRASALPLEIDRRRVIIVHLSPPELYFFMPTTEADTAFVALKALCYQKQ